MAKEEKDLKKVEKEVKRDLKKDFSREVMIEELKEKRKKLADNEILLQNHLQQIEKRKQELFAKLNATVGRQQEVDEMLQLISPEVKEPESPIPIPQRPQGELRKERDVS